MKSSPVDEYHARMDRLWTEYDREVEVRRKKRRADDLHDAICLGVVLGAVIVAMALSYIILTWGGC